MKTTIIVLLLSICFLPLTISAGPPFIRLPTQTHRTKADLVVGYGEYPTVLDSKGRPVVDGDIYYAKVVNIYGADGGISAANFVDPTGCPSHVFVNLTISADPQQRQTTIIRPIIFHQSNNPTGEVQEVYQTNVEFYKSNPVDPCPVKWKFDKDMIVTGYKNSVFSIMASDLSPNNSYIFVDIGMVDDLRRLGINYTPTFAYQFVKFQ